MNEKEYMYGEFVMSLHHAVKERQGEFGITDEQVVQAVEDLLREVSSGGGSLHD